MRVNPCRYCFLSTSDEKGKHRPSLRDECVRCELLVQHTKYLIEQRKFLKGSTITTLEELLNQEWVYRWDKVQHIEAIKCMQLRGIIDLIKGGHLCRAIRKSDLKGGNHADRTD